MKTLLVIFAIYISHVICEGSTNKYAVKSFPKKVKPYGSGKIVINSGKYELKAKPKATTKSGKREYTVFQVFGISKTIQGVPDSPYFPGDLSFDHKTRVKKVLPDYPWTSLRNKRSAVLDAPAAEINEKKIETTSEKTPERKEEKIGDKIKELESKLKKTEEKLKDEIEKSLEIEKQNKGTKDTEKEIESTKNDKPEKERKTDTSTDKQTNSDSKSDSETAKKVKPKREKINESKTITEENPKKDEKHEFRSNDDKLETKSDANSDTVTNKSKESLRNRGKAMKATSRPEGVKSKGNDKETNAKTLNSRSKSKGKEENIGMTTRKVKVKGTDNDGATNVKVKVRENEALQTIVRAKGREKESSATIVKAKSKDIVTNNEEPNVKVKSKGKDRDSLSPNVRAKKGKKSNAEETAVNAKSRDKKREKDDSGTSVRAKPKGRDTIVKTKEYNDKPAAKMTNIRVKKNNTSTRLNRGGKKQKLKGLADKQSSPRAKKGDKATPQRSKNARSKKSLKTKPTNGSRTGKKPKAQRRLIAAREALIEDYPYMVSIQKNEEHWCSGALLNQRLVITTANCLWKANRVSRMEVRAGSRHLDRGGQMAGIQEVMKHPNWGLRKSPDNDVALVLLNKNIKFSDSCHAVDLPNRVMMPPFDDAWVTSWGAERRDGVYDKDSTSLQVYHARLMDREKCNNVTMRFSVIVTENFICLAQLGKTAPCTRDTGAPAVSDGVLWALASWGIRKLCGTERFPAVFSYLASHSNLDFITNATHYLMSDKRYYPFGDRFPSPAPPPSSSSSTESLE